MKILITADLHYDVPRSRGPAAELMAKACREGGDAIVLVGDTAGTKSQTLTDALDLLADFDGLKLIVPGNHCLWRRDGGDSLEQYNCVLPEIVRQSGFCVLDHAPVTVNDVGLVGSVGWYDYSFAEKSLGIPKAFYEAKVSPGAAAQLSGYESLLAAHHDSLTERQMSIRARWMDGTYVNLPMSDAQFCRVLADKLAAQLADLSGRVERIVAFCHHLPFAQLVPEDRPDQFAFAAAFLGSEVLGRVLLDFPKVTHVYCGHSHWPRRCRIGHIDAINIGSTYTEKRLEILEL